MEKLLDNLENEAVFIKPPKIYSDKSYRLETIGCGCCSHELNDTNISNNQIYLSRKKIYVTYIKGLLKEYNLKIEDIK